LFGARWNEPFGNFKIKTSSVHCRSTVPRLIRITQMLAAPIAIYFKSVVNPFTVAIKNKSIVRGAGLLPIFGQFNSGSLLIERMKILKLWYMSKNKISLTLPFLTVKNVCTINNNLDLQTNTCSCYYKYLADHPKRSLVTN